MRMQVRTVRTGVTRVDWDAGLLVVRKPRSATSRDDLSSYAVVQGKHDGLCVVVARRLTYHYPAVLTTQGHDLVSQYPRLADTYWYGVAQDGRPGWIHGELHAPGEGREAVKTALVEDPDKLRLAVIGVSDVPVDASLFGLEEWCVERGLDCAPFETSLDALAMGQRGAGYDGVVYKTSHYGDWVKVKSRRTIDCVVTDVKPGVGKYWGKCGALVVGLYDSTRDVAPNMTLSSGWHVIASVSGMDDATRDECWPRERAIGRVVEVAYERVGSGGRLQHPRFVRWRDDKQSTECTADQDEDLTR